MIRDSGIAAGARETAVRRLRPIAEADQSFSVPAIRASGPGEYVS